MTWRSLSAKSTRACCTARFPARTPTSRKINILSCATWSERKARRFRSSGGAEKYWRTDEKNKTINPYSRHLVGHRCRCNVSSGARFLQGQNAYHYCRLFARRLLRSLRARVGPLHRQISARQSDADRREHDWSRRIDRGQPFVQ